MIQWQQLLNFFNRSGYWQQLKYCLQITLITLPNEFVPLIIQLPQRLACQRFWWHPGKALSSHNTRVRTVCASSVSADLRRGWQEVAAISAVTNAAWIHYRDYTRTIQRKNNDFAADYRPE
ncbi:hypothetical protein [Endozoicomonas sp. SCSIO W0465]|uniref:hypothetical protein n=1 Tax=Endozoicomonas sp. SCSIO W0465 TaxID=2918516 RepID=UPI002075864B|nr:hypothetical protein [Endozoicomonas sp. SCSIO W0465]USE38734.1 hypothetical protein MJO57_11505 [Endozoicomonas sp. SCSIO W0465]